jgi:hypothetical protein
MKTKLTLSIERSRVAKLRKASMRKGSSISELVEAMADKADTIPATGGVPGIRKWFGSLADIVRPEDYEEDSRAGAELRKTEAYQRVKAERNRV